MRAYLINKKICILTHKIQDQYYSKRYNTPHLFKQLLHLIIKIVLMHSNSIQSKTKGTSDLLAEIYGLLFKTFEFTSISRIW